jgi:hypothetical protein
MMDLSSFVDGALAIFGMAATLLMAGSNLSTLSGTVSAPEGTGCDHQSSDCGQMQMREAA